MTAEDDGSRNIRKDQPKYTRKCKPKKQTISIDAQSEDQKLPTAPIRDIGPHEARTGQATLPSARMVRVRGRVLVKRVALLVVYVVVRVLEGAHGRERDGRAFLDGGEVERPEAVGDPALGRRSATGSLPRPGLGLGLLLLVVLVLVLVLGGVLGTRFVAVALAFAGGAAGHGGSGGGGGGAGGRWVG